MSEIVRGHDIVRVRKMGGSLYIALRPAVIDALGVKRGDFLISTTQAGSVTFRPMPLDKIIAAHGEVNDRRITR